MKHAHEDAPFGRDRDDRPRHGHHHRDHGHHHRGRRGSRLFDDGELRLLVLSMIAEQPRHGDELMRMLEERTGGRHSPGPGVIRSALAWLEDMGYARIEVDGGGRRSCSITPEGRAFHDGNGSRIDALSARIDSARADPTPRGPRHAAPAPVTRGMENLRAALRLRLGSGALDLAAAGTIAAALDVAAQAVERA